MEGIILPPTSKRTPKKPTQIKIKETITTMNFPNCQSFNDATEVYDDFIQKIMVAIDKVEHIKKRMIKQNPQQWFDGEISEAIKNRDKLLNKI